jgi:predicted MFS family arabinose efflux permease
MPQTSAPDLSESGVVRLLAVVNFVNVLDFMMVLPLGPDFAHDLGIPMERLGFVGGSYTLAAALAGGFGAFFLDQFDRKSAFAWCITGLGVGTVLGAFADDLYSLLAARMVAGVFGGQATALSLSILSDAVPAKRRGRAMGTVMGAFAAASVLGVPAGLELSRWGGWRTPFIAVGALACVASFVIRARLPRTDDAPPSSLSPVAGALMLLRDPAARLALSATALVFVGTFSVIPHLSTYVQHNLGFPREYLSTLYLAGGAVSFFAMRLGGAVVDRNGPHRVTLTATLILLSVFAFGFLPTHPVLPPVAIFMGLMVSNSVRGVALNSLATQVPPPEARARFMSINAMVQHTAAAAGAMLSGAILYEQSDHHLGGIPVLVTFAMGTASVVPLLIWQLASRVKARAASTLVTSYETR